MGEHEKYFGGSLEIYFRGGVYVCVYVLGIQRQKGSTALTSYMHHATLVHMYM